MRYRKPPHRTTPITADRIYAAAAIVMVSPAAGKSVIRQWCTPNAGEAFEARWNKPQLFLDLLIRPFSECLANSQEAKWP